MQLNVTVTSMFVVYVQDIHENCCLLQLVVYTLDKALYADKESIFNITSIICFFYWRFSPYYPHYVKATQ